MEVLPRRQCEAPLSGLLAISPSRGEIRCHAGFRQSPTLQEERRVEAANLPP